MNTRAKLRGAVGRITTKEWRSILTSQEGKCARCDASSKLTVDHVIPIARGGPHWPWNVQGLCADCNRSKYDNMTDADVRLIYSRPDAVAWLSTEEGAKARAYIESLALPAAA